jgi:hypothetical protein
MSSNKLGMVVHFCYPSNVGGIDRRTIVQGSPMQKTGDPV